MALMIIRDNGRVVSTHIVTMEQCLDRQKQERDPRLSYTSTLTIECKPMDGAVEGRKP